MNFEVPFEFSWRRKGYVHADLTSLRLPHIHPSQAPSLGIINLMKQVPPRHKPAPS